LSAPIVEISHLVTFLTQEKSETLCVIFMAANMTTNLENSTRSHGIGKNFDSKFGTSCNVRDAKEDDHV